MDYPLASGQPSYGKSSFDRSVIYKCAMFIHCPWLYSSTGPGHINFQDQAPKLSVVSAENRPD